MPRVLLAEDNETNREMVRKRLALAGFEVVVAGDGAQAVASARSQAPDLILMDLGMPELDGWEATRRLKADPATRDVPVIALTAHAMAGDRDKAFEAGCDDYETKPVEMPRLLTKIEALLKRRGVPMPAPKTAAPRAARPAPKPAPAPEAAPEPAPAGPTARPQRLLVVDDTAANRELLRRRLSQQGYEIGEAADGRQALEQLGADAFELVLLDIMMPELDGYQVLKRMKADPTMREIPVLMISALDTLDSVVRCIELGAEDYLTKPFDPVLLRARITACLDKKRLRDQELEYLRNVAAVTAAAAAVERGDFNPESLAGVAGRPDELGQLARIFQTMARQVRAREEKLKQEVQQLRVEIDESRKSRQVAEITETDYFQSLQQKAKNLRRRMEK